MMRVAKADHAGTRLTCPDDRKRRRCRQGRLGEAVARVDPEKRRPGLFDDRDGATIHPTAPERRDIARHPEQAVAVGTVAFGRGTVSGQYRSNLG